MLVMKQSEIDIFHKCKKQFCNCQKIGSSSSKTIVDFCDFHYEDKYVCGNVLSPNGLVVCQEHEKIICESIKLQPIKCQYEDIKHPCNQIAENGYTLCKKHLSSSFLSLDKQIRQELHVRLFRNVPKK